MACLTPQSSLTVRFFLFWHFLFACCRFHVHVFCFRALMHSGAPVAGAVRAVRPCSPARLRPQPGSPCPPPRPPQPPGQRHPLRGAQHEMDSSEDLEIRMSARHPTWSPLCVQCYLSRTRTATMRRWTPCMVRPLVGFGHKSCASVSVSFLFPLSLLHGSRVHCRVHVRIREEQ
jgi:hypothetical protein